jgi:hypothetical protein
MAPLPRVTEQTRRQLLKEIDEKGPFEFTRAAVGELGQSNPPLRFGIGQSVWLASRFQLNAKLVRNVFSILLSAAQPIDDIRLPVLGNVRPGIGHTALGACQLNASQAYRLARPRERGGRRAAGCC